MGFANYIFCSRQCYLQSLFHGLQEPFNPWRDVNVAFLSLLKMFVISFPVFENL